MKHVAMTLVRCFGALLICALVAQSSAQTAATRQTTAAAAQSKGPVLARNTVDLNLVLALDASGSVDDERFELQKQGYVRAFLNPRVLDAIRSGNEQAIAVSMVQWTGPTLHEVMVPWTVVRDERSAQAFGVAVSAAPRRLTGGGTSVSGAIDFSVMLLDTSPYRATRRVIDISGDGSNNLGRPPEQARDEAVAMGIRINGLPILMVEPDLDQYFRESVIGGPGAFVIVARNYDQFADAILRKLVTEISQTGERPQLAAK